MRRQLAKKTRQVEAMKRVIDDVPGRAELSQYQRRFIELYNQGKLFSIVTLVHLFMKSFVYINIYRVFAQTVRNTITYIWYTFQLHNNLFFLLLSFTLNVKNVKYD